MNEDKKKAIVDYNDMTPATIELMKKRLMKRGIPSFTPELISREFMLFRQGEYRGI